MVLGDINLVVELTLCSDPQVWQCRNSTVNPSVKSENRNVRYRMQSATWILLNRAQPWFFTAHTGLVAKLHFYVISRVTICLMSRKSCIVLRSVFSQRLICMEIITRTPDSDVMSRGAQSFSSIKTLGTAFRRCHIFAIRLLLQVTHVLSASVSCKMFYGETRWRDRQQILLGLNSKISRPPKWNTPCARSPQ